MKQTAATDGGGAGGGAGGEENMEHLQGDLRTLITRFLDPKVCNIIRGLKG